MPSLSWAVGVFAGALIFLAAAFAVELCLRFFGGMARDCLLMNILYLDEQEREIVASDGKLEATIE